MTHLLGVILALAAGLAAGGFSEASQQKIKQRFREGKLEKVVPSWYMTEPGTFLVVVRPGLPWNPDIAMVRNNAPNPAEVDIREGIIARRGRYQNLLKPGTLLGIWKIRFKGNRIEIECRTLAPYPVLPYPRWRSSIVRSRISEEMVTTRIRFFFEDADLKSPDASSVMAAISEWVRPFDDLWEAIEFSKTIDEAPPFDVLVGMTEPDVVRLLGTPRAVSRPSNWGLYSWTYPTHEISFRDNRVVGFHRFFAESRPKD